MNAWWSMSDSTRVIAGRVLRKPTRSWTRSSQSKGAAVLVAERRVARQRLLAGLAAFQHRAQLAPARQPEVERGADALRRRRQAVPGAVAGEEDAVLDGIAHLVGDPVALIALGGQLEVAGQANRRLLDAVARVKGADADAALAAGREAPRVPPRARSAGPATIRDRVRWTAG